MVFVSWSTWLNSSQRETAWISSIFFGIFKGTVKCDVSDYPFNLCCLHLMLVCALIPGDRGTWSGKVWGGMQGPSFLPSLIPSHLSSFFSSLLPSFFHFLFLSFSASWPKEEIKFFIRKKNLWNAEFQPSVSLISLDLLRDRLISLGSWSLKLKTLLWFM